MAASGGSAVRSLSTLVGPLLLLLLPERSESDEAYIRQGQQCVRTRYTCMMDTLDKDRWAAARVRGTIRHSNVENRGSHAVVVKHNMECSTSSSLCILPINLFVPEGARGPFLPCDKTPRATRWCCKLPAHHKQRHQPHLSLHTACASTDPASTTTEHPTP